MGNEGDQHLHTHGTLAPGETKYVLVDADFQSVVDGEADDQFYTNVDIWGSARRRQNAFHRHALPLFGRRNSAANGRILEKSDR